MGLGFRVQVSNDFVLAPWIIAILVLVLGKYMIIRYLDPSRQSKLLEGGYMCTSQN